MQASRTAVAAAAALGVLTAGWTTTAAAQSEGLRGVFGAGAGPKYPPVARFEAAQGRRFVFDRSNGVILLKFDDHPEIWVLRPKTGPRGDTLYVNDVGQPVVRMTMRGGLTLFTPDRPTGAPVAFTAKADPLKPRRLSPGALLQHLAQASSKASKAARRLLPFAAPEVSPGAEVLLADAAYVAADGVAAAAATPAGRVRLSRLKEVRFTEGVQPSVRVQGLALEVVIAPGRGMAGRPSSRRAAQAILEGR